MIATECCTPGFSFAHPQSSERLISVGSQYVTSRAPSRQPRDDRGARVSQRLVRMRCKSTTAKVRGRQCQPSCQAKSKSGGRFSRFPAPIMPKSKNAQLVESWLRRCDDGTNEACQQCALKVYERKLTSIPLSVHESVRTLWRYYLSAIV